MASKFVETIYRLKDEVSSALGRIGAAWRSARNDAEEASRKVDASAGFMTRGFAAAAAAVKKFGAAIAAVGVAVLVREAVQASIEIAKVGERFEDIQKKLATAFGGVAAGEAAFERLQSIAAKTPFEFEKVAAAAVEMRKRGLDPLDGSLQALLDNAAANDQSMSDLAGTIEALGKASLRGEVGTRALVSLTEKGIPVFQLLSKALGKSEAEIRRMAESGQLGATEIKLLVAELGKLRAGAAAAEVGDLDAQLVKLRDTLTQVQADIAADGSLEAVRSAFQRVNAALTDLANSPEFQRLEESISGAIEGGAQAFENLFDNVNFKKLASEFGVITEAVRVMVNALAASDVVLEPLLKVLDKLTAVNQLMIFMAKSGLIVLADGLDYVAQSAAKAADEIEAPINPLSALRAEIEAGKSAFDGFAKGVAEAIAAKDGLTAAAKEIAESLGSLAGPASEAREKIAALFQNVEQIPTTGLGDIALALGAVGRESQAAAENVRTGLRAELAKMTGEDLLRIQRAWTDAFAAMNTASGETAAILKQTLFAALEDLGVRGDTLGERFSASGKQIVAAFQTVTESAYATAAQIERAFEGALAGATTTAEAEALGAALQRAAEQGKIGLDAMARSAVDMKNRLLELQNAADPLADSFKALAIESQRELDRLAEAARGHFESIRRAAQTGAASVTDVGRAFESMARSQLAAVAGASEFERKQVEASLRAQGAALGLTDALERLGLVGRAAGEQVAAGADRATDALRGTERAAAGAADAASDLASSNNSASATFADVASSASAAATQIDGVSDAYIRAVSAQAGLTSAVAARGESRDQQRLQEQNRLLEEELARVEALNRGFDETEQVLGRIRGRFDFLDDNRIRPLAEAMRRLEENERRAAEEAERRRREAQERQERDAGQRATARRPEAQTGSGAAAGGFTVNYSPTIYGAIDDATAQQWARPLLRQIEAIRRRGG